MIELPAKFKQALGNGVRTSLYPIVRIYKDIQIDDPIEDATDIVNLSIKETNISGSAYKPLLLNTPSISSKADIINNKYTISSVSLSVSNVFYKGKIFSDDIPNLLNAVVQVYYAANGINELEDCLLVYTGTIRRFSQSAETIKLELEDLTQQKLSTKIPTALVEEEQFYKEEDMGKPYPMVYGYVDKSPLIPRSLGQDDMGELRQELSSFHIDKKSVKVKGLWETPNSQSYGASLINDTHPLVQNNYLQSIGTLSVYSNNFFPIPQKLDIVGWSFYVGGITDPDDENYEKIVFSTDELVYNFKQGEEGSSPSITINANALINTDTITGLPSRVYRPIDKIECFTFCDDSTQTPTAINRIYGFTNYDLDSAGDWKPWEQEDNVTGRAGYEENWSNGDQSWWEPTKCNTNTNGGDTSAVDQNWKEYKNTKGFFPVDNLQDGLTGSGMYLCGRNPDGARGDGNRSGGAAIKLILKDNVGSFPCSSKIVYDAEYHSFTNMSGANGQDDSANTKVAAPAAYWTGTDLIEHNNTFLNGYQPDNANQYTFWDIDVTFPNLPDRFAEWEVINSFSNEQDQASSERTVRKINGFAESKNFNNTTTFNEFKFGIPQYPKQGSSAGNDIAYTSILLFNSYLLQDVVIDKPLEQTYYADVGGRVKTNIKDTGIIINVEYISIDYPAPVGNVRYTKYTTQEPHNLVYGDTINIVITDNLGNIYNNEKIIGHPLDNDVTFRTNDEGYHENVFGEPSDNQFDGFEGIWETTENEIIISAQNILKDILESELNYTKGNVQLLEETDMFQNAFTLNEQKEAKKVFEGLFKSSLIIPAFDERGQFKFIPIHQILDGISYNKINSEDILKYSFDLTKLDDIKNQVNIKYKKNYASGEFDKETGYKLIDANNNEYDNYDEITQTMYPNEPEKQYTLDYYNLKNEEGKLEIETEYIRDELTARKLQKRLVSWYANQHLIVKVDLPVSYMNLEVGDYIKFEGINNQLAFGYNYTIVTLKNGQIVYPVFFITSINKSLSKISIEAIQIHRGEYGFSDGIIIDEVGETVLDDGGNNGQGDFGLGDPNDNSDYEDDTIVDEEINEEVDEEIESFSISWHNGIDDLDSNPEIIVNTTLEGEFTCEVFIIANDEILTYGTAQNPQIMPPIIDTEWDASNYLNTNIQYQTNASGNIQGGKVILSTDNLIPIEHESPILGLVKISYQGTDYLETLNFTQQYQEPFVPELGDINEDGTINILDAVIIVNYIVLTDEEQASNYTNQERALMNINNDDVINVLDVVQMVQIILSGEG